MRRAPLLGILVVVAALTGCAIAHPPQIGSAESVLAPCFVPHDVDTTGWHHTRMFSMPMAFRLPRDFAEIETRFEHGGVLWSDGTRYFMHMNGVWGRDSFGSPGERFPGYSECTDTLGGVPFRIITMYDRGRALYRADAVPIGRETGLARYSEALEWRSPDINGQRVFLTVLRTLRPDSSSRPESPAR
jgi:hypothetical protein